MTCGSQCSGSAKRRPHSVATHYVMHFDSVGGTSPHPFVDRLFDANASIHKPVDAPRNALRRYRSAAGSREAVHTSCWPRRNSCVPRNRRADGRSSNVVLILRAWFQPVAAGARLCLKCLLDSARSASAAIAGASDTERCRQGAIAPRVGKPLSSGRMRQASCSRAWQPFLNCVAVLASPHLQRRNCNRCLSGTRSTVW